MKINKLDIQQNRDCIEYVSLCTKNPRKFQVLGRFTTLQDLMSGLQVRGGSKTRRAPGVGTLPRTHTPGRLNSEWPRCSVLSLESKIDRVDCPCGKADTNSRAERCFARAGTSLQGTPHLLAGEQQGGWSPCCWRAPGSAGGRAPPPPWGAPMGFTPPVPCGAKRVRHSGRESSRTQPPSQAGNTQGAAVVVTAAGLSAEGEQNAPCSISRHS